MDTIGVRGERLPWGGPGIFFLDRAEEAAAALAAKEPESLRLVYLDPPFGTGDSFSMRPGGKGKRSIPTYTDKLGAAAYLDMMRAVLGACRTLLKEDGSLFLHVDQRKSAHMRLLLDEIFGADNFVNEIIWAYKSGGRSTRHFSYKHDTIFFYRKSRKHCFNIERAGVPRGPQRRNHMKRGVDAEGRIFYSIRSGSKTYTYYEDSLVYPSDVWDDIEHLHQRDPERTGYNSQKPEALLKRILEVASGEGDAVADFFSGSGTTAAVAAKLGRRCISADASPIALAVLRTRALRAAQNHSLFAENAPLELRYAPEALAPLAPCALGRAGEELVVQPPPETSLMYAALCDIEEGFLVPRSYSIHPAADGALRLALVDAPFLQAVDVYGRQSVERI